jgi:hypothetical protein
MPVPIAIRTETAEIEAIYGPAATLAAEKANLSASAPFEAALATGSTAKVGALV